MKNPKAILVTVVVAFISLITFISLVLFFNETIMVKDAGGTSVPTFLRESHTIIMYVWVVLFIAISIAGSYYFLIKKKTIEPKKALLYLAIGLASTFILKIIISSVTKGFEIDTGCFTAWATGAGNNLFGFYTPAEWCDYPPLYISILSFCGKLVTLGIPKLIAIRLPALIAEIGISIIIYQLATKNFNRVAGIFLALLFAMNPLVIFDTSIWGQMDVVLAFFIVCAITLVLKRHAKYPSLYFILSSILFASAILIKPQALFFLPILIFALIKNKKFLPFLYSGLTGIATIFLLILPFDKVKFTLDTSKSVAMLNGILPAMKDLIATIAQLPVIKDFLWLLDLFMATAGRYNYISANAANTYFPFGKNGVYDSMPEVKKGEVAPLIEKVFGLDYATFGIILLCIVIVIALIVYLKGKHSSIPWFTAVFLNVGIFMTATRMHERYMFTVVALLVIAFIYSKDIITPMLGALFTLTIYMNVDAVFTRQLINNYPWIDGSWPGISKSMVMVSITNVLGFVILLGLLLGLAFNNYLPIFKTAIVKPLTRSSLSHRKLKK